MTDYPILRVLLFAGSAEARDIVRPLAGREDVALATAVARGERPPRGLDAPLVMTAPDNDAELASMLDRAQVDAVIDASHPCAAEPAALAARACAELRLPRCRLLRPRWRPGSGDRWYPVADEAAAARQIPSGARVFVATGRDGLDRFADHAARKLVVRSLGVEPAPPPVPRARFLRGRPPFSVDREAALFRRLGIDWLVVRNAGGAGAWPKVEAARRLGLPVAMICRPRPPAGPVVETAEAALDWLEGQA